MVWLLLLLLLIRRAWNLVIHINRIKSNDAIVVVVENVYCGHSGFFVVVLRSRFISCVRSRFYCCWMATVLLQPRNRCVPDSRHNSTQKHKNNVYIRIKTRKNYAHIFTVCSFKRRFHTHVHIYNIYKQTERHYTIQLHHTSASASGVAYIHKRKHSIIFMDLINNVNFYTHNRRKIDEWKVKTERTKWTENKNLLTHTHTTHPFDTYIQNCGRRREEKKLWARDEWTAEPIK